MGIMKKIFILHGWTYATDKWQDFITCLKSNGFEPVLLNIPGLTAETDRVWTLDNYVEWLKKALGSEKAIIIGHSNGGRIALAFAAKYSDKLKHLILIDSAGIHHNEFFLRLKRLVFGIVAKIGKKITSSEKWRALLYKAARESDYANATPQTRQTMVNLISSNLTSQLSKITVSTLIIWGQYDQSTPLSDGTLIHQLIQNSKLSVVDGAKHSPQFTHTQEVCKKILQEIET